MADIGKKSNAVDLGRLTQSQAAWLIQKPAAWLRDNPHCVDRNADGTYDARRLLQGLRTEFEPAALSDGELEPLMQFAEDWAYDVGGLGTIIAGWRRIEVRYGPAGQAAIAREILRQLEAAHEEYGDDETETLESLEEEFAKRRADLTRANLYRQRRRVLVCDQCDKYRWGRRWVSANPPVNMARIGTTCPSCEG